MSWTISITSNAKRQLKRLPKEAYQRIRSAIDEVESDPWKGDVLKLGGTENIWRRRVGNYRFKFRVFPENQLIQIYEIERRTSSSY